MLNRNPQKRLGAGSKDAQELKEHPFFAGMSWTDIIQRKAKLPKPVMHPIEKDPTNTKIVDSPADEGVNKLEGWTFVEPGKETP